MSDVWRRLSRTSGLSREHRGLGRPKLAHVTCDSDTTFKVNRSKVKVTRPLCSPPCWRVRRLQRWAWKRVGREKLLLHAVCSVAQGASAPTGRGISWRPPAYSLLFRRFISHRCHNGKSHFTLYSSGIPRDFLVQLHGKSATAIETVIFTAC